MYLLDRVKPGMALAHVRQQSVDIVVCLEELESGREGAIIQRFLRKAASQAFEASTFDRKHTPEYAILPQIVVHQGGGGMKER